MADDRYLTTRQVAARLGVSLGTVQQMVESGALEAWKTAGGHRRILANSVESYIARTHPATRADNAERPLDILIAEDDPLQRKLYETTLASWQFPLRVRLVDNGFDGLVEVGRAVPDILIADLVMPAMDGFEMVRRLRERSELATMDILVVSSLSDAEIEAAGGLPPAVNVYQKPVPFHELKGYTQARLTTRRRS
ncbi:MAG: response regulator [Azonexus sp.]|nr:response regulator [Betaproteobacteria bacterium]MBK8919029.1 response regulator [Betaproteobacteria bacterium]MBP6036698.1 response regulator [Azonexus sp.]MBP6905481.1 response regulator [Azonexus sp.]